MATFFISYSHSNRSSVERLVPQITTVHNTASVWFDDGIPGGVDWWNKILAEIGKCEVFIFLISDDAAESEFCQKELREAVRLGKPILPVIVSKFKTGYPGNVPDDLKAVLNDTQYIDLSKGFRGATLAKLWGATNQLLQPQNRESDVITKLTRAERWILSNQFEILAKLDEDQKETWEQMRTVVESGYELHYDWMTSYIYDGDATMSARECLEVVSILDMFSTLKRAYESLTDKSGIDKNRIEFVGFDGNYETKFMAYTRFLIKEEGRFPELDHKEVGSFSDFNSHFPVRGRYQLMLDEWENSDDDRDLTKDDLIRITSVKFRYT